MKKKNALPTILAGVAVAFYLLSASVCRVAGPSRLHPYTLFKIYNYPLMMVFFIAAALVLCLGFCFSKSRLSVPLGTLLWQIAAWWSITFISDVNHGAGEEPIFYAMCVVGVIGSILATINIVFIATNKCRSKRGKVLLIVQSAAAIVFTIFYLYILLFITSWYVTPMSSLTQVVGAVLLFSAVIVWAARLDAREPIGHLPPTEQLKVLKEEMEKGIITAEEYEKEKARILASL